jgi:deazaflavin-dependent oxidoreductase (nitroreductase family)
MSNDQPRPPLDLSLFGAEHVRQYRETNGEVGYLWNGAPCLILTTKGRNSGEWRDQPLIFGTDEDTYILIASQGGAPKHPMWYLNLVADPNVELQVKGDRFAAVARVVEGQERERLWKIMTATWPSYDVYQTRTDRVIPLVALTRA